jgi:hypothetical protein
MAIVSDFIPGVISKMSNRTDIQPKCVKWIADAVKEITASYPFDELRITGDPFQLTINDAEYNKSLFINPSDDPTMICSFFIYFTGQSGPGFNLKFREIQTVEPMSKIPGIPIKWSRHGRNIVFGFMPNAAYYVQMRYQRRHTFNADPTNDQVLVPEDWFEIIEYAAALRAAWDERMYDYCDRLKTLLYGDPEFQLRGVAGKGQPGLIHRRLSQFERDANNNERQLPVVVQRY